MPRITPYSYLRIGGFALAAAVLCLLILFLTSTPVDPLIQAMTLLFYLAATLAMGGVLRHQFRNREAGSDERMEEDPDVASEVECDNRATTDTPTPSAPTGTPPPVGETPSILLLTRQPQTATAVRSNLSGWRHGLDVVGSCAEASQRILNLMQHRALAAKLILIIDIDDLEMDPVHLPDLIRQETGPVTLRLIALVNERAKQRCDTLREAGFHATLIKPIDKSQLFASITAEEDHTAVATNIVNLASYRQKQGRRVRKHVLLADRRTAERERITALLKTAGHRVKLVENGEQALDALERQRFDVALINLRLPIMNGTQVIKLHRFTTPHPEWVSFIVMTDETTPATLRLCRDLQVRACLFKPVPTDSLLELIDTARVVSPAVPATIEHVGESAPCGQETEFLHADLLDTKVLQALDQLDNESNFVPDLIAIFSRDSIVILLGMEEAVECHNSRRFAELSSILMDNAGQLGAFALYETCLTLQRLSHQQLESSLADRLTGLRELVERTNQAFRRYLSDREQQHSDRS